MIREQRSLANHYADAGSHIEVHIVSLFLLLPLFRLSTDVQDFHSQDKDAVHDILTLPWFAFGKEQKATIERTTAWIQKLYA